MDDRLGATLERLLAKEEISEALLAYARGVDQVDLDLIRSVFHSGAIADYGRMFQGSAEEFAAFIGEVHPPMETHTHHLSNIYITVDGDRAGSEAYVNVRARMRGDEGEATDLTYFGRYVDTWERREGIWRIAHRRYLHSQDEMWPVRRELYPVSGTRGSADPSYAVLATSSAGGAS